MLKVKAILKEKSTVFVVLLDILAIVTAYLIFRDQDKPSCFGFLPIMPLVFMAVTTAFRFLFDAIPDNLGVSLILAFQTVRMLATPLFIHLSNYIVYFDRDSYEHMPRAILLMAYECLAVFTVLALLTLRDRKRKHDIRTYVTNEKKYRIILLAISALMVIMIILAPQSLGGYRTLISLGDEKFTHFNLTEFINLESTGVINRLAMVLQRNIALFLRILFPGMIIIALSKKRYTMPAAFVMAATPLLIVDDAIGRGLYYAVILCYLIYYIYKPRYAKQFIAVSGVFAFVFLCVYWTTRHTASSSPYGMYYYISRILNSYFSGVYMANGAFNLNTSLRNRFIFFIMDILKSVPFGNTIFRVGHIRYFQSYYNQFNHSYGMIPPTIAMGKFYFGTALAPIYSCIFAAISYIGGKRAIEDPNPYRKMTHLLTAVIFAFSFNMYTVQITYSLFFYIIAPAMIIEWMSRERSADVKQKTGF